MGSLFRKTSKKFLATEGSKEAKSTFILCSHYPTEMAIVFVSAFVKTPAGRLKAKAVLAVPHTVVVFPCVGELNRMADSLSERSVEHR